MKEGTEMETHLKHMKEITDKLAAIGAPISEEDQIVTLLGSLPRSYCTLVTALEARGNDGLTLSFVQQALIHEEQKLNGRLASRRDISPGRHKTSALVGAHASRREKLKCFGCGIEGHIRRNCPRRKNQESRTKQPHKAKPATEEKQTNSDSDDVGVFAASAGSTNRSQMGRWLVDSGASSHMTCQKELLTDYKQFDKAQKVGLGDGRTVEAVGIGKVKVNMLFKMSSPKESTMHDVLYVPKLTCNLFSVRAAAQKGNFIKFGHSKCWIRNQKGKLCGMGSLVDKLYQLDCEHTTIEYACVSKQMSDIDLWHQRLGHISGQRLREIVHKELVTGVTIQKGAELSFCEGCVEGKMSRKQFKPVGEIRSRRKLQLIHSDVCGPMQKESIGGSKYFVTFIDDYSRCCSVYFIRHKSEVAEKFKEFELATTNECSENIEALRSDNGGEYCSEEFKDYLKSKGIRHELAAPYSPQQNGVAERMNRTLVEAARSMLAHANLPEYYWAEAVATAVHIKNRTPTTALKEDKTPFEMWYEKKPNVTNLKVFGCVAYAHIPETQRQKLDKKSEKLRFIGYSREHKGYRLINEQTKKVIIRRDVVFNETDFGNTIGDGGDLTIIDIDTSSDEEVEQPVQLDQEEVERQRPERHRRPPVRYGLDDYADHTASDHVHHVAYNCHVIEPKTIEEAMSSDYAKQWKEAADSEYASLIENNTWNLVKLPKDRKPIGCKWVFKVKYNHEGKIERFKGRLVAKGYAQNYGIDYVETFSPVVRFSSIRTLLAFAVQHDMLIHQMDVVTAFLNGQLDEEIYMQQPDGYIEQGKEDYVCKLNKSLYGLKQSPRCWNTAFREYMQIIHFKQSTADPCVYIRRGETTTIVAVYVDDLIIMTKTMEEMEEVKESLAARFKMKDMGKLHYCLGISIQHDERKKCLWIHQRQYILNMIKKYGLSEAKQVSTPADVNVKLKKDDDVSKAVDPSTYQSMIGSLLYAALATRPDISQAVSVVSKFNKEPTEAHLTAVKRIFKYLKGTNNLALKYQKTKDGMLIGYSDADYAGDLDDRHSTTGNIFLMYGGPISWLSKKQAIVALSTSEAEYVALSLATQEVVWLRRLLDDLQSSLTEQPTVLMEDNQGAIAIAKNPVAHCKTKHIDIRYHYIREAIQNGTICLNYCPTNEMIADLLTKPLSKGQFETLRAAMGMEFLIDTAQPNQLSGSVAESN